MYKSHNALLIWCGMVIVNIVSTVFQLKVSRTWLSTLSVNLMVVAPCWRNMQPNMAARLIYGFQKKYGRQCRSAEDYGAFPVNSTHYGLVCFSWNTFCCYLTEKKLTRRLITGPTAVWGFNDHVAILQAAHLIKLLLKAHSSKLVLFSICNEGEEK